MKRLGLMFITAILVAGGFAGGVALASGEGGEATAGAEATVGAQSPNARLALYVGGGASAGTFTIARAKGVASVSNPTAGVWCVRPSVPMTLTRIVPDVGVEYNNTLGYDSLAQWNAARPVCSSGRIQINTFASGPGTPRNQVAWTLTVS